MKPPLVSILIPAFNAGAWIADTIASAVQQTWPNKEVIVVDDGSRDDTLSVARACASSQVKVVTQANQGAAAARNQAYSICQGDYIQWLDADDLLGPDKIAKTDGCTGAWRGAANAPLLGVGNVHVSPSQGAIFRRRRSGVIYPPWNG